MPYEVELDSRCPASKPWGVRKIDGGKLFGCHPSKKHGQSQVAAMHANEGKAMDKQPEVVEEKCGPDEMHFVPFAAKTFADLEAVRATQENAEYVLDLAADFKGLAANILTDETMIDKPAALKVLADEFAALVAEPEPSEEKATDEGGTNEHAARVRDPGDFVPGSFRSKPLPKSEGGKGGVRMIIGKLKGGTGSTTVQAYRFPAKLYTAAEAKAWLKKNEVKYDSFREATAGKEREAGLLERVALAIKDWLKDGEVPNLPEPEPHPAFVLWKEGGGYRWVATYSNKWRDHDRPPEILSEASHQDFVKAVDAGEWPAPELWLWHVDGTRWGTTDWTAYADGFALASGPVDKESTAIAERLEAYPEPLAVSHGMPVKEIVRDANDPTVITRYRTREISVLPAWAAANALTGFQLTEVKEMAIPADKKDFLRAAGLSDERVAAIEAELEGKAKEAADAGLEFKATETPPVSGEPQPPDTHKKDETPASEPAVDNAPPAPAPVAAPLTAQDVAAALREVLQPFEQRLAALETLKEQVTALNKSEDERVNEALAATPAASLADLFRGAMGTGRAIGSKEARIDGRGSLAKSKPAEAEAPDSALQITGVPFIDTILGTGRPQ